MAHFKRSYHASGVIGQILPNSEAGIHLAFIPKRRVGPLPPQLTLAEQL